MTSKQRHNLDFFLVCKDKSVSPRHQKRFLNTSPFKTPENVLAGTWNLEIEITQLKRKISEHRKIIGKSLHFSFFFRFSSRFNNFSSRDGGPKYRPKPCPQRPCDGSKRMDAAASPTGGWEAAFGGWTGWLGCDFGGAKELGVMNFPTNWGAKEP